MFVLEKNATCCFWRGKSKNGKNVFAWSVGNSSLFAITVTFPNRAACSFLLRNRVQPSWLSWIWCPCPKYQHVSLLIVWCPGRFNEGRYQQVWGPYVCRSQGSSLEGQRLWRSPSYSSDSGGPPCCGGSRHTHRRSAVLWRATACDWSDSSWRDRYTCTLGRDGHAETNL